MRVLSLNVGKIGTLNHAGEIVPSAIGKQPIEDRVGLGLLGFTGDQQADRKNHGGSDKAVCVYASEHYHHFGERLGKPLGIPAFGENLTTVGMLEAQVCIGDVYGVGSATLQVSQPRQPCFKLGARHGEPRLHEWVRDSRLTGFYFRVLQAGEVQVGDAFELLSRGKISVARANELRYGEFDREGIQALVNEDALSASWQRSLRGRLLHAE